MVIWTPEHYYIVSPIFSSFRQKSLWIRTDQLSNANEGIVENVGKCGHNLTTVNHD